MKKLLVLTCMAALVLAGQAMAQCSSDPNEVCIFFSQDCNACTNCLSIMAAPASAYVILLNGTQAAGVSGYEFCLCNGDGNALTPPANVFVTGYTYPPGAINAATEPCFAVGLATPLAWSPCITMLTVNLLVYAPTTWCFGLKPATPASIPGEMAYADGADPGLLLPMYPCTAEGCFMACVNNPDCPPPTAVEPATWGNVKALYQ
jgi:hypothetical protein